MSFLRLSSFHRNHPEMTTPTPSRSPSCSPNRHHHTSRRRKKPPTPIEPPSTASSPSDSSPPYPTIIKPTRSSSSSSSSTASTVYWGWIALAATWFVCVLGFGSVIGVWEWAWGAEPVKWPQSIDGKGQRFPIAGYYPAMVVLSAVMAWVWVTVAWVGMKYFKHAKIQG